MKRRVSLLMVLACAGTLQGQCTPDWLQPPSPPLDNLIYALQTWDPDGPGPATAVVVAGGNFTRAGGTSMHYVGAWDGAAWRSMGSGIDYGGVLTIALYRAPSGGAAWPTPVVGGFSTDVRQWDGASWQPLGVGIGNSVPITTVDSMRQFGPDLYVGGWFRSAGGLPANGIARWDGSEWHSLQDERPFDALDLFVFGGELYAGGYFEDMPPNPTPIDTVLRYGNGVWVHAGDPQLNDAVFTLAEYRGQLVAGGFFQYPSAEMPQFVAAFDGTHWTPLGAGLSAPVEALCVFDPDGPGPMPELLIAAGRFNSILPDTPANHIAAWDGTRWFPLGSGANVGTNGQVNALAVLNNQLVVGGQFTTAGGMPSPYFAVWGCPQAAPCYANCDQSTEAPVLNVNDFICFLAAFSAGSPYANCDGSTAAPVMNVNDFICFMGRFAQGCP